MDNTHGGVNSVLSRAQGIGVLRWFAGPSRCFFQAFYFYMYLRANRSQLVPIYGCLCLFIRNEIIGFISVTCIYTLFYGVRHCRTGTAALNRQGARRLRRRGIDALFYAINI